MTDHECDYVSMDDFVRDPRPVMTRALERRQVLVNAKGEPRMVIVIPAADEGMSEERRQLAEQTLMSLDARTAEDGEEWARILGGQIVCAEYVRESTNSLPEGDDVPRG